MPSKEESPLPLLALTPGEGADGFEAFILSQIEGGQLKPLDRLPTTAELATTHGVDLRTVQNALSSLAAKGFLERKPRRGTFIKAAPRPPKATFLTGWNLEQEPCYMPRALVHHLREALAAKGYSLHVVHDLFRVFEGNETAFRQKCAQLKEELTTEGPSGFIEYHFRLNRLSEVYPGFPLPSVTLTTPGTGSEIEFDRAHFINESLRHLHQQGCRRILLVRKGSLVEQQESFDDVFWAGIKEHRFAKAEIREILNHPGHPDLETAAAALMRELAAHWATSPGVQPPDGLIVGDDIIMRGVATGLLRAPKGVSGQLKIVHLANEGIQHHYGLPAARYEVSPRVLAAEIATLFDLKLRKKKLPMAHGKRLRTLLQGHIVAPGQTAPSPTASAALAPAEPHFGL